MARLQSREEYREVVEQLAVEYTSEIVDGGARDIAAGVIADRSIQEGKPRVHLSASVWGGKPKAEALDEALLPYEVILYSEAYIEHVKDEYPQDVEGWAVAALTLDLESAADETPR